MPLPSLTQTLFGALLDSPVLVEVTARVLEKAMPIIKEHFTLTADEITKAYQDACGYSFVAISIGLDAPDSLIKKVRHSKITREFAKQIEENYYKPFSEQNGVQRFSFVKPLQKWAKKTDKLFEIKEITENSGSHAPAWEPSLDAPASCVNHDAGASSLHSHASAWERECLFGGV